MEEKEDNDPTHNENKPKNGNCSLQNILQLEPSKTVAIQYHGTLKNENKNITYTELIQISDAIQKEISSFIEPFISDDDSRVCLGLSSQPTPHLPILVYSIIQTRNLVLRPVFLTPDTFEDMIIGFLRTCTKF